MHGPCMHEKGNEIGYIARFDMNQYVLRTELRLILGGSRPSGGISHVKLPACLLYESGIL